jgi:transcriptional regulator with XRE-family HTH domain
VNHECRKTVEEAAVVDIPAWRLTTCHPCVRLCVTSEQRVRSRGTANRARRADAADWMVWHEMDDLRPARGSQALTVAFAPLLREFRDRRRLSQSKLAERAGFDHSYVSRLESASRMPTRDAVLKLAEAMGLSDNEQDALLAAAGFMPGRVESLFASEPVLSEVLCLLQDGTVPAEIRDDVRHMISLLVRQAHRAALSTEDDGSQIAHGQRDAFVAA